MKTKLFLKTLLVAVCLLVGSNGAWGAKTVVGALDNSSDYWSEFSDYYTIEPNGSLTLTFTNYSSMTQNYHNWIAAVTTDADRGGDDYSEYLILRADHYGWGNSYAAGTLTSNYNWDTFKSDMNGSNVIMKVTRSGATVTVHADITTTGGTEYYENMVITAGDGTQDIRFFLSTEKGHIENLTEGAWNKVMMLDFENSETFSSGWSGNATRTQEVRNATAGTHCMESHVNGGGDRNSAYTISNTDFTSAAVWKMEFDWGASPSNGGASTYVFQAKTGNLFTISVPKYNETVITIFKSDGTTALGTTLAMTHAASSLAFGPWFHFIVTANPTDGVLLTVQNETGDVTYIDKVKVAEHTNANGFSFTEYKGYSYSRIDNILLSKAVNPVVTTKYELSDGTTLIDDVETEVIAGNSFTPSYPSSFQSGTKEYTYKSGGDEIASVTADQTVTIVYDEDDMPAGTYYAQTFEKNGSLIGWTTGRSDRYNPTILGTITNKYLSVGRQGTGDNGTTITCATFNQTVDENTDFTLKFDVLLINAYQSETSRVSTFQIADYDNAHAMLKLTGSATGSTTWIINDNADQTVTLSSSTWYTVQYSRIGSLTYLTITPQAGGEAVFAQQQISTLSTDGGLGKLTFVTDRYNADLSMDNILVRAWQDGDTPEVTETTYTIQYRDEEGNEIKDDVVNPTTVGTEDIVASSSEIAAFYNVGRTKKYIYKSGNTPITAVADEEENVITLVFREAETYSYTVTNNLGTTLSTGSDFEDEKIYIPFPRYELNDGKLYAKAAISSEYRYSFTLSADEQEETVTGYTDSNIPAVVFYAEGEDLEGVSTSSSGNILTRSSNSAVGYRNDADRTIFSNLPAGTYQIFVAYFKPSSSAGISNTFTVGGNDYVLSVADGVNLVTTNSEEFTLTSASDVVWTAGTAGLDYIYIKQTAVSVTIGSSGYASYCSPYDLDFSSTGVKAYKVNVADGRAKLTEITGGKVPANTGVVLGGAEDTYSVPVATETPAAVSDNEMVGVNERTQVFWNPSDNVYNYILQSGVFNMATDGYLKANRAYLSTSYDVSATGARTLTICFEDDVTTGIADVRGKMEDVRGEYFDLQGRKINGQRMVNGQLPKGLYIVNGKKVFVP